MATLDNINAHLAELQAALAQAEASRKQAEQQERDEKTALVTVYENEANGYRNQAAKATTDDDKQRLYRFAQLADEQALQLRVELGLVSQEQVQASNAETAERKRLAISRKINALFIKATFALIAFWFADFTSAQLEMGFMSFALKSLAQLFWFVGLALGGCWLACSTLFVFVAGYGVNGLHDDFRSLTPGVRLAILAGLLAALLHYLTAVVPHAN